MAEVRVVARSQAFIADDGVKHTEFPVNAIAHGGAQRNVGRADVGVVTAGGGAEGAAIRAQPEFNVVAGSPRSFVERLVERDVNDIQVDLVRLVPQVVI